MSKTIQHPFDEDWLECLRSHYFYVVRTNDFITEPTLRIVLLEAGISEADIDEWYQIAASTQPHG